MFAAKPLPSTTTGIPSCRMCAVVAAIMWQAGTLSVVAQPSPQLPGGGQSADLVTWDLESVQLQDGAIYRGLVLATDEEETEFAEIVQPPGKPMFVVIRPLPTDRIQQIKRLDDERHAKLAERLQRFRYSARIEAGSMASVQLQRVEENGTPLWRYTGDWFTLDSAADASMTRRCIVRAEQIFRAYRQLLTPRTHSSGTLRIRLFGEMDGYREFLRTSGFNVSTPAFYSATRNTIIAGSDLNAFSSRLRRAQEHNARVRQQYEELMQTFPERLAGVLERMRKAGYQEAEIEREAKLRRGVWQREYDAAIAKLKLADYRNASKFEDVTTQMFKRLNHEAFHAYAANYVYSDPQHRLPRWLNEGLAQIFESGQLDMGVLRIDAPDAERLSRLRRDLTGASPLSLADVLESGERDFVAAHGELASDRLYLYSWGLAYYLAFDQRLLGGQQLDDYVANPSGLGPTARFVAMVGMPLGSFETHWRDAMLRLTPNG